MNCPCPLFDLLKYKDKPYLETPCASCFMTRLTNKTNKHSILYDTDGAIDESTEPSTEPEYDPVDLSCLTPEAINLITEACEQNFLVTLSNIVLKLTDLAKTYPTLYKILHMKMQHPEMSYFEIGRALGKDDDNKACSKQNVLYHLTHAVELFPDLYKAILTDTRFSGGRYAIKNVADKAARQKQIERVRKKLYSLSEVNTRKSLDLLQKEFNKPYKVDSIDDYKDYMKE